MLIWSDSISKACVLGLFFFASPCLAAGTLDDLCREIGSGAEAIMTARQAGAPLSTMIAPIAAMDQADPLTQFMRATALAAYEEPHWNGDKMQAKAISDFRSDAELRCYTEFANAK